MCVNFFHPNKFVDNLVCALLNKRNEFSKVTHAMAHNIQEINDGRKVYYGKRHIPPTTAFAIFYGCQSISAMKQLVQIKHVLLENIWLPIRHNMNERTNSPVQFYKQNLHYIFSLLAPITRHFAPMKKKTEKERERYGKIRAIYDNHMIYLASYVMC